KGRVAFEAPAAEVLLSAHRELEKLVLTGRQQRIKELLAQPYGDLVHEGQLLDPVCRDIEALLSSSQQRVTGEVHLLLRSGSVFVEGVESPFSLMAASRGVYGEAPGEWSASDALGFSRRCNPGMSSRCSTSAACSGCATPSTRRKASRSSAACWASRSTSPIWASASACPPVWATTGSTPTPRSTRVGCRWWRSPAPA